MKLSKLPLLGLVIGMLLSLAAVVMGCQSIMTATPAALTKAWPPGLTFLVLGDWGIRGLLPQQAVANQMAHYADSLRPAFVVTIGDNFCLNGVNSVTDPQWQQSFEQVYTGNYLQIPFKAVLGSHDYEQPASVQAELNYNHQTHRWQMPARYFTKVVAIDNQTNLWLIYLDTNPFVKTYPQNSTAYPGILEQDTGRQLAWLDSVLTHTQEPWKIVVGHHFIRSVGTDHGDQSESVDQLQPLLTKYHVQLHLCGHSHTLQHLTAGGTTDYIVSGGGGAPLGEVAPGPPARFAVAEGGFTTVSLTANSVRVGFMKAAGYRLYQMQRGRGV